MSRATSCFLTNMLWARTNSDRVSPARWMPEIFIAAFDCQRALIGAYARSWQPPDFDAMYFQHATDVLARIISFETAAFFLKAPFFQSPFTLRVSSPIENGRYWLSRVPSRISSEARLTVILLGGKMPRMSSYQRENAGSFLGSLHNNGSTANW